LEYERLIKECSAQKRTAQEELYRQFKDVLYSICLKYCRNEDEAKDILHNAFIEIFFNIRKFSGKGSFEGWLKRITINKAIDSYKKSLQIVPIKEDYFEEVTVPEEDLEISAEEILLLVQELPNQYRLVFNLYELDDYSHQQISKMLGISESTSKSNLHRAKLILREKIISKNPIQYKSGYGK
jgi:RNA polymerase sigma-70 factor (ECF subfamily)